MPVRQGGGSLLGALGVQMERLLRKGLWGAGCVVVSLLGHIGIGPAPMMGGAGEGLEVCIPERMLTSGFPQPAQQWRASGRLRDLTIGVLLWRGESRLAIWGFLGRGLRNQRETVWGEAGAWLENHGSASFYQWGKWVLELQRTFQDVGWGEDEALKGPGRGGKAKPAQPY